MFGLSTQDVIDAISRAVSISDPVPYLEGTYGDQSDGVVNQLFCCILCQESVQKSWIVSCFAGCQLAIKVGTRVVDLLGAAIKKDLNQGMEGWLFEMLFFAMIRNGGVHLVQKESSA